MVATRKEIADEIIELNINRAAFYRKLGYYFFKELTNEQIEKLANQDFTNLDGGDELLKEGYHDIHQYLRLRNTGTRQTLAVDYAHTFLAAGNYTTFAATPYESVFTSELGLMMQDARDEVYKMYCAEKIQPDEELHTPEDHISFEFEFLATLLERMNKALRSEDYEKALYYAETMKKFHEEHQLNWVDDLCDTIIDIAKTRFYRGVSKITRGFVHIETQTIDDVLDSIVELKEHKESEANE